MDKTTELLSQLRDVHLPPAIDLSIISGPWATGRFVTLALLSIAIIVSLFFIGRWWRKKNKQQKLSLQLRNLYQEDNFAELSSLLRRVALRTYPKADVASLHDERWLAFLDSTHQKKSPQKFQSPVGELLLDVPYRKSADDIAIAKREALFKLVESWLIKNY